VLGEGHPGARQLTFVSKLRRGIHTESSLPRYWRVANPWASSLSVLCTLPIITLALARLARSGRQPAASISSTIQYQSRDGRDVAIADTLQGNRGAFWQVGQEALDRTRGVAHPDTLDQMAPLVQHNEEREVLARPCGLGEGARRNQPYNRS